MAKNPVDIDFDTMSSAVRAAVLKVAKTHGSTVVYVQGGYVTEEEPRTSTQRRLRKAAAA